MKAGSEYLLVGFLLDVGRKIRLLHSLPVNLDVIAIQKSLIPRNIFDRIAGEDQGHKKQEEKQLPPVYYIFI